MPKLNFMSQALLLSYTQSCYCGDDSSVKPTEGRMITRTACTLRCFREPRRAVTMIDSMPHPDCTQHQAGVWRPTLRKVRSMHNRQNAPENVSGLSRVELLLTDHTDQAGLSGNQNCARYTACAIGKVHLGMSVA